MNRTRYIVTSSIAVGLLCVFAGAWAQEDRPSSESGSETPPVAISTEEKALQASEEIVEITRPEPVETMATESLGRIVTARQAPQLSSVEQRSSLDQTLTDLGEGNMEGAREAWTACVSDLAEVSGETDVESFILYILNKSFLQMSPDLLVHAEKVRFYNEQKRVLQEHLTALRKHESAYTQSEIGDAKIESLVLAPYVPGGSVLRSREQEQVSHDELGPRIEGWERVLYTIEENVESSNSKLRIAMKKERAMIQAMSAASKMLHEIASQVAADTQ